MNSQKVKQQNQNLSAVVFTEIRGSLILTFPQSQHLSNAQCQLIQQETLTRCAQRKQTAVIFDLSALTMIDLTEWHWFRQLGQSIRLMGSQAWFVGIQPTIIMTLVHLDAKTQDQNYALGVEEALSFVEEASPLVSASVE